MIPWRGSTYSSICSCSRLHSSILDSYWTSRTSTNYFLSSACSNMFFGELFICKSGLLSAIDFGMMSFSTTEMFLDVSFFPDSWTRVVALYMKFPFSSMLSILSPTSTSKLKSLPWFIFSDKTTFSSVLESFSL